MRNDTIDLSSSVKKGQLIRKSWMIDKILESLYYLIIFGSIPILSALYLFSLSKINQFSSTSGFILFFGAIMFFLISREYLNVDKLRRVKGQNSTVNRRRIISIAKELNCSILRDNKKISILSPPWDIFKTHWGREIVVIYDKNDVLINSTTYLLHDLKSPVHIIGNRRLVNQFIKHFKESKLI